MKIFTLFTKDLNDIIFPYMTNQTEPPVS